MIMTTGTMCTSLQISECHKRRIIEPLQATIVKPTGVVSFSSHIYCNCTHSQKSWCTFIVLHYHIIFSDVIVTRQRNCFTFIGIPANSCSNWTLNATIEKSMVGSLVCENNDTPFMVLHQLTPKKLIFEGLSQEVNLKKKRESRQVNVLRETWRT